MRNRLIHAYFDVDLDIDSFRRPAPDVAGS